MSFSDAGSEPMGESMSTLAEQVFVMVFQRELSIGLGSKKLGESIRIDDVYFRSSGENHLTTFCDRLLDPSGRLVGVNITPISDSAEALMRTVKDSRYVTVDSSAFQVWFTEAPLRDAENNGEQAFGGYVFSNDSGEFALSIDADFLFTSADEARLSVAHARWVAISA